MKVFLLSSLLCAFLFVNTSFATSATVVVATHDSSPQSQAVADFVGDGFGDQDEINLAIQSLPPVGGSVILMEGTYDIRKVPGKLGGVIIERSNVTLSGQGTGTRLIQAAGQETNVIRILGSGVGNITIENLSVDANRAQNPTGGGDPNVSHARFEYCGIKAYCAVPGGTCSAQNHDITVRNTHVANARTLGVMLAGTNMNVVNNRLSDATSDIVEILVGPGQIQNNYFEVTGRTHVAVGSDAASNILMSGNVVRVRPGGLLDIGFRSWALTENHVISNNVLMVDVGGTATKAMDIRGTQTTIVANTLSSHDAAKMILSISAGDTVMTGNVLKNVIVTIFDTTGTRRPIIVNSNIFNKSSILDIQGSLITDTLY
jgi:hypothetical protein